jgi:hypothetical protein
VNERSLGGTTFTRVDGSFELVGVEPGVRYVRATHKGRSSEVSEIVVGGEEPDPIELVLEENEPDKIHTRVLNRHGNPSPGAFVFLETDTGRASVLSCDSSGQASAVLLPPHPNQVRLAAFDGVDWALGNWISFDNALEELQVIAAGSTGSILVSSEESVGFVNITSQHGWRLSWMLQRLGYQPRVGPQVPMNLSGLPPGSYYVSVDGIPVPVSVSAGKQTEVELQ